ncbi:MAG: hypothetical protein K8F24_00415, partial [Bacteroidales bacterium]|nr:hypothetical protein [Bacteroidales bacterium]
LDQLLMDFNLDQGDLSGFAQAKGDFGTVELLPKIQQLQTNPTYQLKLTTQKLNIAALTGDDSLQSCINMVATINGRDFDPEKLALTANLMVKNSTIAQIELDTLFADVKYSNENINIDSLLLLTKSVVLSAYGNYNMKGHSAIDLKTQFIGLEEVNAFIPLDSLQASGLILASIRGTVDSLNVQTSLHLAQISYPGYNLDSLNLDGQAFIVGADTTARINMQAFNLRSDAMNLDSIVVDVDANMDSVYVDGRINNPDLSSRFEAGIVPGEVLSIPLADLIIDYKNQH